MLTYTILFGNENKIKSVRTSLLILPSTWNTYIRKNDIAYILKRHLDEFINVFYVFINDIGRYIATSGDLKNEKNKKFFSVVFFFPLSSICRRFKNRRPL